MGNRFGKKRSNRILPISEREEEVSVVISRSTLFRAVTAHADMEKELKGVEAEAERDTDGITLVEKCDSELTFSKNALFEKGAENFTNGAPWPRRLPPLPVRQDSGLAECGDSFQVGDRPLRYVHKTVELDQPGTLRVKGPERSVKIRDGRRTVVGQKVIGVLL